MDDLLGIVLKGHALASIIQLIIEARLGLYRDTANPVKFIQLNRIHVYS